MVRIAANQKKPSWLNAISDTLRSHVSLSNKSSLLLVFLIIIIFTSFIIPFIDFGRLYGTDDYSHLFHTQRMSSGTSLNSFYDTMRDEVSNSEADINPFN